MARFLAQAAYTPEGVKGLMKEGGSARKAAVGKAVEGLGGKLASFDYAFGGQDVVAICDLPDVTSAAALSLALNAAGAAHVSLTPLLSAEEVDAACKKAVSYRAPGK